MRVYFDTEFLSEAPELHLISIGMVTEDGQEYYAVNKEAPWDRIMQNEWLVANVVPHLPLEGSSAWKTQAEMRKEIVEFVGPHPEFWAYIASYDWVVLCNLFGQLVELPDTWPFWVRDLKWFMQQNKVKHLPPRLDRKQHDALADAWEVRTGYDWCLSYSTSK